MSEQPPKALDASSSKMIGPKTEDNFSMMTSPSNEGYTVIRKLLINSAVNFLNNPRLKLTSKDEKKAFLTKKGLTVDEIDLAFDLSVSRPLNEANLKKELDLFAAKDISSFSRLLSLIYQIIVWGGFCYGAYSLYQERIRPYLDKSAGKLRPEELICEQIKQLNDQILELSRNVAIVHEFVSTYCKLRDDSVGKMKNELQSIKALLVNTNQFPSVPTIPKWQFNNEQER